MAGMDKTMSQTTRTEVLKKLGRRCIHEGDRLCCLAMQITLPSDSEQKLDASQIRLDLAVGMYAASRVTLGRAAEIVGVPQMQFQPELAARKVPLHYDHADLATDLQTVRELTKR
jgi:predicted HTH domain antitoxin